MAKPVNFGRRSEIYNLGNGTVFKIYDLEFPKQKIIDEFNKAKTICDSGLKIPRPIELIEKDGRTGILFEEIKGMSLMDIFQKKPWLYFSYQKRIANIHRNIHRIHISGLPTQNEEFKTTINNSSKLSRKEKDRLLKILGQECKPVLCHGDFHHGNIILNKSEYYVVDWMDAFSGDFRLDVGLTAVNAAISDAPGHVPSFYRHVYEVLKRTLRLDRRYLSLYGIKKEEMRDFMFLAAGIHLARCVQKDDSLHRKYFEKTKLC